MRRFSVASFALCVFAWLPATSVATPLNPNAFASLGTLNLTQNIEIQTSNLWYTTREAALRPVPPTSETPEYVGVIDPVTNTAVFTFDSINLPAGLFGYVLGTRPVVLLSRGPINIGGTLSAGIVRDGVFRPGSGFEGDDNAGGGGGGFGGRGGDGALNGTHPLDFHGDGGPAYGDLSALLTLGSPGGAGGEGMLASGGAGGDSGGAIEIGAVGPITFNGHIEAFGVSGGTFPFGPGGGGGSGGAILIHSSTSITLGPSALLDVYGGAGGEGYVDGGQGGGGGGGGGRVYLQAPSVVNQGMIDLSGGVGGVGAVNGQPGATGSLDISLIPEPSSITQCIAAVGCLLLMGTARNRMNCFARC